MVTKQSNSIRKGIGYGAFGGFIASIAFTGIMLWLSLILSVPVGIFLHALGLSVINPESGGGEDAVHVGLAAFGLVLAQGVIVGIIFGIVTSKIKRLHISNKKKGAGLGLATGVIVYIVLFVAVTLTVYPSLLTSALTRYPQTTLFSLQGTQTHIMTGPGSYLFTILGYALFAYLVYGFILGGILVWAYSIYNFDLTKLTQLEKAETNKTKTETD